MDVLRARRSRLALAVFLATLLIPTLASSVSAECSNLAIDPIDRVQVGAAFLATANEVSHKVIPNPDGSDWNLHVRLSVDTVYYGAVPRVLEFNDYAGFGCGEFQFEKLEVGDEIIVAVERPPLGGHVVVWKRTGVGWAFFEDALAFGSDPLFYPGAAREATTKSEILQVLSSWTMPPTSTVGSQPSLAPPSIAFFVLAFGVGLAVGLHRFRRPVT
jgi:hypothetical protein